MRAPPGFFAVNDEQERDMNTMQAPVRFNRPSNTDVIKLLRDAASSLLRMSPPAEQEAGPRGTPAEVQAATLRNAAEALEATALPGTFNGSLSIHELDDCGYTYNETVKMWEWNVSDGEQSFAMSSLPALIAHVSLRLDAAYRFARAQKSSSPSTYGLAAAQPEGETK